LLLSIFESLIILPLLFTTFLFDRIFNCSYSYGNKVDDDEDEDIMT